MVTAIKEELYKFNHERISLYGLLFLLAVMAYGALTGKMNKTDLIYGYDAIEWIPIIIIAVASAFFAMEYNNNTIIMLLYKNSNKLRIYLAKFFIIFLYAIFLTIAAVILTFLLSLVFVPGKYHWTAVIQGHSIIGDLLINMGATLLYCFFITGLSFMLIMLVKVNAIVICIGLFLGYVGASISVALMAVFPSTINIIKWNPLSMIFISQQLTRSSLAATSHLSNIQLVVATIMYGIVFGTIGYFVFKHRRI